MKAEVVKFSASDGTTLNGLIFNYKEEKDKVIISTHGMGSNCFKPRDLEIANLIENTNISLFTYNNRGTEIISKMKRKVDGEEESFLAGAADENVLEGYFDVKGAIEEAINLGYKEIFLQGHSLGSTKTVYTYNKLKEEGYEHLDVIKGVILLSLVDIPQAIIDIWKLSDEQVESLISLSRKMIDDGRGMELMPEGVFVQPVSAKEFVRLCVDNEETNFARYHDKDYKYEKINNIDKPLFMRWGNNRELISQNADELVQMLNEKIINTDKDINYIDGADHSFHGYENILAKQIVDFVNRF